MQGSVFGTFKTDPNAPIDIEANTLDMLDPAKQAIFRSKVKSQQGDFIVRTVEMTVYYTGQSGFGLTAAAATMRQGGVLPAHPRGGRQKVLIISKDGQTATGDWANFDVKANTVLLGGHVVVSRGKDVAEGPRLKIDLTTGMYRFELETEAADGRAGPRNAGRRRPCTAPDPASVDVERPRGRTVRPASSACCSSRRTPRTRPRT